MALYQPSPDSHWRDSAREAKFFFFDAKASVPFLLFLLHIKLWTFILAAITMAFFTILNRYGFSMAVFLRLVRSILAGRRKISILWWT